MRITFEMFGDVQFSRELVRVGARAGDASPVFNKIADDWVDWNQRQFESEGARASGGWDPLAPSTIYSKEHSHDERVRSNAHRILRATDALMNELTDRSNIEITDSWMHMTVPDDVDYGRFHQTGTTNMPRRRPLEFTDLDRREMVRDIQLWVIKGELR